MRAPPGDGSRRLEGCDRSDRGCSDRDTCGSGCGCRGGVERSSFLRLASAADEADEGEGRHRCERDELVDPWPSHPPMLSRHRMIHKALLLVHLVGFAAYLGAGFAQQRFMKRSREGGLPTAIRDEYERLAATVLTKIELPALMAQVMTGVGFVVLSPAWLKLGWLHGKLACVVVLLGLSHAEMFNARAIVKLRAARGEDANAEVEARKSRHATFGAIGTLAVIAIVGLVVYGLG